MPFCTVSAQTIEKVNDSTFVCGRGYIEFIATKFDSLERMKALHFACEATLQDAIVANSVCDSTIAECEDAHDAVFLKTQQQSLMIQAQKEQIQILNRSNEFLNDQLKKQRRKSNRNKFFAVGGGVAGGFIIGALTVLLSR